MIIKVTSPSGRYIPGHGSRPPGGYFFDIHPSAVENLVQSGHFKIPSKKDLDRLAQKSEGNDKAVRIHRGQVKETSAPKAPPVGGKV